MSWRSVLLIEDMVEEKDGRGAGTWTGNFFGVSGEKEGEQGEGGGQNGTCGGDSGTDAREMCADEKQVGAGD